MTEAFLSFIWKYKFFQNNGMFWDNEVVEIINPGELNTNAGPDFINAKIRIGETIWAGTVEIHMKASDWELHNHDQNAAFDNVILHVTHHYNKDVYTSKGRKVPTITLEFDKRIWDNYETLDQKNNWVACADKIKDIDRFTIVSYIASLGVDRLENKIKDLAQKLNLSINNWEEIFYRQLARSFGFHVNAPAFEMLSVNLPFKILQKYSGDIKSIESLLFGVSGFLENDYSFDSYYVGLKNEYHFLKAKYQLKTMDIHLWKFLRLRPGNFPTVRIAQFAALINNSPRLLPRIIEAQSVSQIKNILIQAVSEYWNQHYTFSKPAKQANKHLGDESAQIIIINTVVPFLFLYGRQMGQPSLEEKAVKILEGLPPEKNSVTRGWSLYGLVPKNSFESQALLNLKSEFCDKKRCIDCRIGVKIISTYM